MKITEILIVTLLMVLAVGAKASDWRSQPADGSLSFTVRLEGSETPGRFQRFEVTLAAGRSSPAGGSLVVEVDTTSADLFSHDINEAIADPEWFDFMQFPVSRFQSAEIVHVEGALYEARGKLNLKGVSRAIVVPFEWDATAGLARMRGNLVLHRSDFGIGSGEWADDDTIAQAVQVEFNVALERID